MLLTADLDLIADLVARLPQRPVTVVDIGAGWGLTARAVLTNRPKKVKVTTIDIDPSWLGNAEVAIERMGRLDDWKGIQADSITAATDAPEGIDLLLLDTSHTYAATRDELGAWLPKMRPHGLVWCHDYVCLGDLRTDEMAQPPCLRGECCGWCGERGVSAAVDQLIAAGALETYRIAGLSWSGRVV